MIPLALPTESVMTPVMSPTVSSAVVVPTQYERAFDPDALRELFVGPSDMPDGIEYDRWVGLVNPAPREAFADSLDLLEYE